MNNLFFNPSLFFSEKSKSDINLKCPAFVILVSAILATGSSILLINNLNSFPSDAGWIMYIGALIGTVGGLIVAFACWIILTGIFYLISSRFSSNGSFRRTLEFVGYGFVPKIFSNLIAFFMLYEFMSSISSSQEQQLTIQSFNQMFASSSQFYISQIIGILCVILSANIWIFALLHARKMSTKDATITVFIPLSLYFIYQIYSLIGGLT